jgi:quercetin dioxygenase-like cupin family protein
VGCWVLVCIKEFAWLIFIHKTIGMKRLPLLLITCFALQSFAQQQLSLVASGVYHLNEATVKKETDRESRKMLEGTTAEFSYFRIHVTTQQKGAAAKPAHMQKDIEELIIIKEGKLKCSIGDKVTELGAGSVMLIPPMVSQAFENIGDGPATYYVLQFRSNKPMDLDRSAKAGGILLVNADTIKYTEKNDRGNQPYFSRPTAMCANYEMHVTTLKHKGPSHAAHQHADTEIILIIQGQMGITIDGKDYLGDAGDLFIANSNSLHQVFNASEATCRYFAFKWR